MHKNQYLIFSIQIGDSAYALEDNHSPECHLIEVSTITPGEFMIVYYNMVDNDIELWKKGRRKGS